MSCAGICLSLVLLAGCHQTAMSEIHGKGAGHHDAGHEGIHVQVVAPQAGGRERTTVQPASVMAFERAELYAKVAGYLTKIADIGFQVHKGDLLAEIEAPELIEEHDRQVARVAQAKAEVLQMRSRIETAVAAHTAAEKYVVQTEAEVEKADSLHELRKKQYQRFVDLQSKKAIEPRLVEEKEQELSASVSEVAAAKAKVDSARAEVLAAQAKIDQAKADLEAAQAAVKVDEAEAKKSKVLLDYTKITAPYDGLITHRYFHIGDFITAANQRSDKPLLEIQQVDLMRVVVQIPDRDVPYVDVGDPADLEIDGIADTIFHGKISRFSSSEDERTRSMRAEVDIRNPDGRLRHGMYGEMTVHLAPPDPKALTVPSACLVGNVQKNEGKVFVYRDGQLHLTKVRVRGDNGISVEVVNGLTLDDLVVLSPGGDLADGVAAQVERQESTGAANSAVDQPGNKGHSR